jgi:hypothetical protein
MYCGVMLRTGDEQNTNIIALLCLNNDNTLKTNRYKDRGTTE